MTSDKIRPPTGDRKSTLDGHIAAIRELGKQMIDNVIEIGRRLTECKDLVGHRNFGNWIDTEFGWAERTAQNFMRAYDLSQSKSANFADLDLPVSAIYLLAAPSTPEPVRDEILERAESGEKMTVEQVKETIAAAKPQLTKRTGADGKERKQPVRKTAAAKPRHLDQPTPAQKAAEIAVVQKTTCFDERDDVGADSTGELERLRARLEDLGSEKRRLEFENIALRSEVEDLQKSSGKTLDEILNAALTALNKKVNAGSGRSKIDKAAIAALSAIRQLLELLPPPVTKEPELMPAAADDGREAARALPMTEVT